MRMTTLSITIVMLLLHVMLMTTALSLTSKRVNTQTSVAAIVFNRVLNFAKDTSVTYRHDGISTAEVNRTMRNNIPAEYTE